MAISDFDRQLLLVQQVGDVDATTGDPVSPFASGDTGVVLLNAERLWNMHVEKMLYPVLGPSIFDFYFKRDGVALVIGVLESRVDFTAVGSALSVRLGQRVAARQLQAQRFANEIVRLETKLASLSAPQGFNLITQIEPITPPVPGDVSSPLAAVGNINVWVPDANDPTYQGSPYWRRTMWWAPVRG